MTARLVACPDAPLGGGDRTRRWGVACADAKVRWPGLTRPEAEQVIIALASARPQMADLLVQVGLDVVLSDGAGPHLADADGLLMLVLGPLPAVSGVHVAMGGSGPERVRVGAVRPGGFSGAWAWVARAEVPRADRLRALDELAEAGSVAAIQGWAARANSPGIP